MSTFTSFVSNQYNQIKTFFTKIYKYDDKNKVFPFTQVESSSYIDLSTPIPEKIKFEKRRRYQTYTTLDYILSVVSYFDFFSFDSFRLTKRAKELSQLFEKKVVTTDLLLLSFFDSHSDLIKLLEKYQFDQIEIENEIINENQIVDQELKKNIQTSIKNILLQADFPIISEILVTAKETKYSYEMNQIFEKAAKNALTRFKTPVISSEILLITMLESKKSAVGKLLIKILKTDTNWHMFRYALMKRLHTQELAIRSNLPKNQQYFAYLLKTQLPERQFDILVEKDCLNAGVLLFRNRVISDVTKLDFATILKRDIHVSMRATNKRKYSS